MAVLRGRFKKSAVGATSVTLVNTTTSDPEFSPNYAKITQLVISTNSATPPTDIWGTTAADGKEYIVTIEQVS
jgi:hypothetical protein